MTNKIKCLRVYTEKCFKYNSSTAQWDIPCNRYLLFRSTTPDQIKNYMQTNIKVADTYNAFRGIEYVWILSEEGLVEIENLCSLLSIKILKHKFRGEREHSRANKEVVRINQEINNEREKEEQRKTKERSTQHLQRRNLCMSIQ